VVGPPAAQGSDLRFVIFCTDLFFIVCCPFCAFATAQLWLNLMRQQVVEVSLVFPREKDLLVGMLAFSLEQQLQ